MDFRTPTITIVVPLRALAALSTLMLFHSFAFLCSYMFLRSRARTLYGFLRPSFGRYREFVFSCINPCALMLPSNCLFQHAFWILQIICAVRAVGVIRAVQASHITCPARAIKIICAFHAVRIISFICTTSPVCIDGDNFTTSFLCAISNILAVHSLCSVSTIRAAPVVTTTPIICAFHVCFVRYVCKIYIAFALCVVPIVIKSVQILP